MKRERDPTAEEFEKLLAWFGSDHDEAGRQYKLIYTRLVRVFTSRGCIDSGVLADEVMNRVAVRIDTVIENYTDPIRCCLGFIEHVYQEDLRDQKKRATATIPPPPRPPEELEREDVCLKGCLESLTTPERELFERYFQGERRIRINNRKKLAAQLMLTANALRIRAYHLRKELHECLTRCLGHYSETIGN